MAPGRALGRPCRQAAVPDARSPRRGRAAGRRNGNYKHGLWTLVELQVRATAREDARDQGLAPRGGPRAGVKLRVPPSTQSVDCRARLGSWKRYWPGPLRPGGGGRRRWSARHEFRDQNQTPLLSEGRNGKTATIQNEDQPKHGRPSAYSDKIAEAICDRLVDGESLRAICADPGMPAKAMVFRWLASNQAFRRSYALARECQAEDFVYEILEIADDSSRDYVKKTGVDGKVSWVLDKEHIAPRGDSPFRSAITVLDIGKIA